MALLPCALPRGHEVLLSWVEDFSKAEDTGLCCLTLKVHGAVGLGKH